MPEVRGGGREELPHIQGAVAERAQEGLQELLHVQGQEGRRWGDKGQSSLCVCVCVCVLAVLDLHDENGLSL